MSRDAVVVLAKAPARGAVKTRLARDVGDDRALALHRRLAAAVTRALLAPTRTWTVAVATTPALDDATARAWLGPVDDVFAQCDGDLGARLSHATRRLLAAHDRVVAVGTDCLDVTADRVREALAALDHAPAVIGPAHDGGYYLLGATRALPVYDAMPWSTDALLDATRARLRDAGIAWRELATARDIDTLDDLVAAAQRPGAPSWLVTPDADS